ncbi:MAG: CDP-alcohol phosphatidyltransferase family protein [Limisphaerales bacterium]
MDAVILSRSDQSPRIAGVSLLDRQVVALFRGGCEKVTIVGESSADTPRAKAHGHQVARVDELSELTAPTLVVAGNVLLQKDDVTRLIQDGGRLFSAGGQALEAGVVEAGALTELNAVMTDLTRVKASGVAVRITDDTDVKWAQAELWSGLGSSTDGLVDTWFNRPLGRLLSKLLVYHTNVSPNQVSVFAICVGVVAGWYFAQGGYWPGVIGAILLQFSAAIDCVDGDIARIAFKESAIGKWLDIVGDQVVHIAVFVGIGVGLWRMGVDAPVKELAISAAVGVCVSFAVVIRGMTLPASEDNAALHKLIDKMTNRDFSVVLVIMAVANQLPLFLWAVGIGVHVFWLAALGVQLMGRKR